MRRRLSARSIRKPRRICMSWACCSGVTASTERPRTCLRRALEIHRATGKTGRERIRRKRTESIVSTWRRRWRKPGNLNDAAAEYREAAGAARAPGGRGSGRRPPTRRCAWPRSICAPAGFPRRGSCCCRQSHRWNAGRSAVCPGSGNVGLRGGSLRPRQEAARQYREKALVAAALHAAGRPAPAFLADNPSSYTPLHRR